MNFNNFQLILFFFQCLITILLLFIPDVYALINYVSFVEVLFILISILGLLYLRVKLPDAKRPIKVNLVFPIIFLITCGFLIISSFYVSPVEVGVGCLIIVSGKNVYLVDFLKININFFHYFRDSCLLCNNSQTRRLADSTLIPLQYFLCKAVSLHAESGGKS